MEWDLKMPPWDMAELGRDSEPDIASVGTTLPDCSVDLKLGASDNWKEQQQQLRISMSTPTKRARSVGSERSSPTSRRGERDVYPNTTVGFVHIEDVVRSHLLAMEDARVSGRLVCSSDVAHWSEILEMLRTKYPSYAIPTKCSEVQGDSKPHSMDSSKLINLGFPDLKTIPEMFDDCIKSFQAKGLLTQ